MPRSSPDKPRCSAKSWSASGHGKTGCSRPGTLRYEGQLYCTHHHPPSVAQRKKQRERDFEERRRQRIDAFRRAQLAERLLARFPTSALENASHAILVEKGEWPETGKKEETGEERQAELPKVQA